MWLLIDKCSLFTKCSTINCHRLYSYTSDCLLIKATIPEQWLNKTKLIKRNKRWTLDIIVYQNDWNVRQYINILDVLDFLIMKYRFRNQAVFQV